MKAAAALLYTLFIGLPLACVLYAAGIALMLTIVGIPAGLSLMAAARRLVSIHPF